MMGGTGPFHIAHTAGSGHDLSYFQPTSARVVPGYRRRVDLERAATPLGAALRTAVAVVVLAALLVDLWVLGAGVSRTSLAAVCGVAALGVGWACWPRSTVYIAVAVSVFSLVATVDATRDNLRFALFTECVMLPVLFGVLLSGRGLFRFLVAGLVFVVGESASLRAGDGPVRVIVAMSMLVLFGAATTAVVYIRLRDNERRTSIDLARQTERLILARELHDVVGHHVTGIVVLAQANRFTGAGADPAAADQAMAAIEEAGLETLGSIRRLVGLLRSESTTHAPPGLVDIEQLVGDIRRTHLLTELIVDEGLRSRWVPPDLATTVVRIVQEVTTNVRKHGDPAHPVRFSIRRTDMAIEVTAENTPIHSVRREGYGVTGMRERVEAFAGTLTAGMECGRWVVRASLPLFEIGVAP
jgi:signal transduction histidine kinase